MIPARTSGFKPSRDQHAALSVLEVERLSKIGQKVADGLEPSEDDVDALDRIVAIRNAFTASRRQYRKTYEIAILLALVVLIGGLNTIHVRSSAAEIDIRTTGLTMTLISAKDGIRIPGETGQTLSVSKVTVDGAADVSPTEFSVNGNFELDAKSTKEGLNRTSQENGAAVRLQDIELPARCPVQVVVGILYDRDLRGVKLKTSGSQKTKVSLGLVIPAKQTTGNRTLSKSAINAVRAQGENLQISFIPTESNRDLAVFRDSRVSQIDFDDDEHHSTVVGGMVYVDAGADRRIELKPGDHLTLRSDEPMLLRELVLTGGELKLRLSSLKLTTLLVGGPQPRNLTPSVFEWLRFQFPAELYTVLSALVVTLLAIRKWIESSE